MWPGPRPISVITGISIHPTVWLQYDNVTDRQERQDRTDRQRTDITGRTVLQTVGPALCYWTFVCLSVCLSVCLFRRHCVRWVPRSHNGKGHSNPYFSAHVYCGQTAGSIRIPLGTQVGLVPGHIVLDGDQAHPRKGAQQPPLLLWSNGWISGYHLVRRFASTQATLCQMGTQLHHGKGHNSRRLLAHVYCGQTVARLSNV